MSALYDEDGIDGPFEKAIARAIREDLERCGHEDEHPTVEACGCVRYRCTFCGLESGPDACADYPECGRPEDNT